VARRQSRVLQILRHLQSGNGCTVDELAGRMDVCRRTIFRDLHLLRDAGVDVIFDEAEEQYRLAPRDDLLRAPELAAHELSTLVAAVHLSLLQGIPGCRDQLRQVTNKLLAVSPSQVRHCVARLAASCTVGASGDNFPTQASQAVHQVLLALQDRRTLQIQLSTTGVEGPLCTRFATYQVRATPTAWQITGRSTHHRAVCTLDPRDMLQVEITDEVYAIPREYGSRL
jgi:predicted DNA-binding transcriptional regulator YafY